MPWSTAAIAAVALVGVLVMLYPSTAAWFTQYNQSQTVVAASSRTSDVSAQRVHYELAAAYAYNDALIRGALSIGDTNSGARIDASSNVPTSGTASPGGFNYNELLRASADGVMARLRISAINVDLPIYHGTSEKTLLKGAGHLEGTSLPVGGESQHSVITAHRGLPQATMFNDLQRLQIGDTFTVEVFGEVLTYQVTRTLTVEPDESQSLLPEYGIDQMTLVTCTPLGLNTHRYLVTGERILPTPAQDMAAAGQTPDIPGFPWWAVALGATLVGYITVVVIAGRPKTAGTLSSPDKPAESEQNTLEI